MTYVAIASLWVSVLGIVFALATGFELFSTYQPVRLHVQVSLVAGVLAMASLVFAMVRLKPEARRKALLGVAVAFATLGAVIATGFSLKAYHAWPAYLSIVVAVHVATRLSFALWRGPSDDERQADPT